MNAFFAVTPGGLDPARRKALNLSSLAPGGPRPSYLQPTPAPGPFSAPAAKQHGWRYPSLALTPANNTGILGPAPKRLSPSLPFAGSARTRGPASGPASLSTMGRQQFSSSRRIMMPAPGSGDFLSTLANMGGGPSIAETGTILQPRGTPEGRRGPSAGVSATLGSPQGSQTDQLGQGETSPANLLSVILDLLSQSCIWLTQGSQHECLRFIRAIAVCFATQDCRQSFLMSSEDQSLLVVCNTYWLPSHIMQKMLSDLSRYYCFGNTYHLTALLYEAS